MFAKQNRRVAEFAELRIEKQSIPYPHHIANSLKFFRFRCSIEGIVVLQWIKHSPAVHEFLFEIGMTFRYCS